MTNDNSKNKKVKFDIKKRQQSAHKAAVNNSELANKAIFSSQNWLLILGLAELSFLGTLLLTGDIITGSCFIKLLIVLLLISFVLFIVGTIFQYKNALKKAREYEDISQKAVKNYLNKGVKKKDKSPEELKLPENQIVTSKWANFCIFASYVLVILSTIGIIVIIFLI